MFLRQQKVALNCDDATVIHLREELSTVILIGILKANRTISMLIPVKSNPPGRDISDL